MSMKKLVLFFLAFVAACVIGITSIRNNDRNELAHFQDVMHYAHYDAYTDPELGFSFFYPSFFRREECDCKQGHCVQFGYHAHNINLMIECTMHEEGPLSARNTDFIDEGESDFSADYKYISHHVKTNGHRLALTFYYPRKAEKAVGYVINSVRSWHPLPPKKIPPKK